MASRRDAKNLLKTYNEYRRQINEKLAEIEHVSPDSMILERYRKDFEEITTDTPNYNTLQKVTAKARKLLESGRLSVEQLERNKAEAINTLQKEGYDINNKNFNAFFRFVDDARARGLGAIYDSGDIIDAVWKMRGEKMKPWQVKENIARWADKVVRFDENGRVKPVENPPEFKMVHPRVKKKHAVLPRKRRKKKR